MKRVVMLLVTVGALPVRQSGGQTQYFNLEAGRPTRVEDAVPTERYALDIQLAPVRVERLGGGSLRWRAEPKVSLGALPFTEFGLRIPYTSVRSRDSSGVRESGVTSMAFSMLRALNLETRNLPGLAIAAEVQLPVGPVSAPKATYSIKALATKSAPFGRIHVNLSGGTYSVRVPTADACVSDPTSFGCGGFIPDAPCSLEPGTPPTTTLPAPATSICSARTLGERLAVAAPRTHGARWMAGLGVDHTFPLMSLLLTTDFVAERFQGFQSRTDLAVEAGARWQWSPRFTLDGGVSRRFAGATTASSVTLGVTFATMVRPRSVVGGAAGAAR